MNTVLIIDDEDDYRSLIGQFLKDHGWQVLEAAEGDEGIELARRFRPDAVLCDLLMPRGNGFQVCRSIRGEPALRHTRIIVTSGRDYESDRRSALDAGADEYLVKPIVTKDLLVILSRLAGQPGAPKTKAEATAPAEPVRVKFWGVRGSVPTPGPGTVHYGGNTSCVEVRADGEIIVLDAGTGLRALGRALGSEFSKQPLSLTLLLSHTHWDHVHGLPYFLPVYNPNNHIRILGYEGARKGLSGILSGQMESPHFPVGFDELPGNVVIEELKDMEFNVGAVRVQARFANHPGICVGYRLFASEGSIAFFPDHEMYSRRRVAPPYPGAGGRVLDFARGEDEKLAEFLRGVDVLIIDAQYTSTEYERHVGWGHGCVDDVVALALKAQARQLFLFHHDPDHDDAQVTGMVEHARQLVEAQKATLLVEAAREGVTVELPAKERAPKPA